MQPTAADHTNRSICTFNRTKASKGPRFRPLTDLSKILGATKQFVHPNALYLQMSNHSHDFDDWFSTNYRRVLSAVLIVCAGDVPRAEDATNDAFLDALEKWPKVGAMDSPRAWVTKVAINKAKRSWLRRKRYVDPVNADSIEFPQIDTTANVDLWEAVGRLSVKQRSAIVLRYVDDLTQANIANELGVAPGTVSATLTQARANLRVELEGEAV